MLDLTDENRFVQKPAKKLKVIKTPESPAPSAPPSRSATPRRAEARTVVTLDLSKCETKENETMDVRLPGPSENTTNSIEDSCSETRNEFICNSINEKTVLGADKVETNVLIDLTGNDNKSNENESKEKSPNEGDTCLKVQQKESTSNDIVNVSDDVVTISDGSENENKERDSDNISAETTEVKSTTEETDAEKSEETDAEKSEEIERSKEAARVEAARLEAEKKKQLEEEERIRAEEEARLQKELKEAEKYESMLREEEKKKKGPCLYEEVPTKKARKADKASMKIEPEDLELFALGRENGTRDYIGQRVLQVWV